MRGGPPVGVEVGRLTSQNVRLVTSHWFMRPDGLSPSSRIRKKTSATTNSSHLKISHPKRKRSYSNHHFSGAMLVSGRVAYEFITAQKFILNKNPWDSDCGNNPPNTFRVSGQSFMKVIWSPVLAPCPLRRANAKVNEWRFLGPAKVAFSVNKKQQITAKSHQRPKTSCPCLQPKKSPDFSVQKIRCLNRCQQKPCGVISKFDLYFHGPMLF